MSATCVPWYAPRGNTGLSKHGNPVFPHFCPLKQNPARVGTMGGGGYNQGYGCYAVQVPNLVQSHQYIHINPAVPHFRVWRKAPTTGHSGL